jgi:predicted MarR family transcription regulator
MNGLDVETCGTCQGTGKVAYDDTLERIAAVLEVKQGNPRPDGEYGELLAFLREGNRRLNDDNTRLIAINDELKRRLSETNKQSKQDMIAKTLLHVMTETNWGERMSYSTVARWMKDCMVAVERQGMEGYAPYLRRIASVFEQAAKDEATE